MTSITPTLSNFSITSRTYGDASFNLTNPVSNNTNPLAIFTFTSSNTSVADISGVRTVNIRNAGQTIITATQSATNGYTTAQITAVFTVNQVTTMISNFIITSKEWGIGSFDIVDPSSNNPTAFSYEVLTPSTISLSSRTVRLLQVGRAQIRATQVGSTNYTTASVIATFDVLTSIVRVGIQNRIDLSWSIPPENGATIKNYLFYTEERRINTTPAPSVSTVMETIPPTNPSYLSYALPYPYNAKIISATSPGLPTGIDVNFANQSFNINTSSSANYTTSNFFDLGYYGEIEVNWEYHNDRPIATLNPNGVASTTMTLSIFKEASRLVGDKRVDLILNATRTYDSLVNCFGPMPQNNNKTMTDIFTITFPGISATDTSAASRDLKYLKFTDVVSGRVTISSNTYSPADDPTANREYSILIKSLRIAPFRFPISRDFTSLRLGQGLSTSGLGFSVSTFNALMLPGNNPTGGTLYHMPKMTRPLTDFNKASWTFSWNYAANLSKLATDISYLPFSGGNTDLSSNLNIPFHMRIRGFSRPYAITGGSISDISYNTTSVAEFLSYASLSSYQTRLLLDVSFTDTANYAKIAATAATPDASFGIVSRTFDIEGSSGFPAFSQGADYSHTQFVFLFQLTITDPSYNAYFRMMTTQSDSFQVKMLSQTFTPYQMYRFDGPDPTLPSSYDVNSSVNTLYNISDYYTPLNPFYSFYNLTNGVFYSYRIAGHNIVGTSSFSNLLTRRCGSIPNPIANRINSLGADTFTIESERTSNRVNIYWEKPVFSGYEITYFEIQTSIDISGRWVNSIEYTPDVSSNLLTFNLFNDIIVPVSDETKVEYDQPVSTYTYNSLAAQQYINTTMNLNSALSGSLINGYKYYFRLAGINELGRSAYSNVLSGIPFAKPSNSPIIIIGTPIIGNEMAIITWKIPQDDAGSPILNYIIDYEEVIETSTVRRYINKTRYRQSTVENSLWEAGGYPFDAFRKVYTGYKNLSSLTTQERNNIITLRNQISEFVINPRPIKLNDTDRYLNRDEDPSKNIILSFTKNSFQYKSGLLNQNVFDLSNIQIKWYYVQDGLGQTWTPEITSSFHLSIRGHLQHNSNNRSRDISGIFDISGTYIVSADKFSTPVATINPEYKYIDYSTGTPIVNNVVPYKVVNLKLLSPPTMYRIDATRDDGYFLILDYTITNISRSDYRFIFYSGQVVLNGIAPVRTFPGLNTEFTMTLKNSSYTPILNGKTYLFTITPFNINDFFPDTSLIGNNYGNGVSQTSITIGTLFSQPVTDISYSLVSTPNGGKVVIRWKYSSKPKYFIDISIPTEYAKEDVYPQEYLPQQYLQDNVNYRYSISTPNLEPLNGIVTYTIPSSIQSDIDSSNAQLYLKSGRGYYITVSPVQSFVDNQNQESFIPAPSRNIYADGTYVIPFRRPLAPLSLTAQGYDGTVTLKWILPNFENDPNYYITNINPSYYRYKYFTLERRDISSADPSWQVISNEIIIPTVENGGIPGYQAVYSNIAGTNEQPIQFRVRNVIVNEYVNQRAESDYTYMSMVNNNIVNDPINSNVYPSLYPYKPTAPYLRIVSRSGTQTGALNGIFMIIDYPNYNGNAEYYECFIEYTPPYGTAGSDISWNDVFNVNNGIADLSLNISLNGSIFTTNRRLRTTAGSVGGNDNIIIVCRNTVLGYGIRVRVYPLKNNVHTDSNGFYPYGDALFSPYSNTNYINI